MSDALAQAEALIEQGDMRVAVKTLDRARSEALAGDDLAALSQILALAERVSGQAAGEHDEAAGRLAYAAQQNIRFLGRKAALAAGDEWVDPFAPTQPAARRLDGGGAGQTPPGHQAFSSAIRHGHEASRSPDRRPCPLSCRLGWAGISRSPRG